MHLRLVHSPLKTGDPLWHDREQFCLFVGEASPRIGGVADHYKILIFREDSVSLEWTPRRFCKRLPAEAMRGGDANLHMPLLKDTLCALKNQPTRVARITDVFWMERTQEWAVEILEIETESRNKPVFLWGLDFLDPHQHPAI